MREYRPVLMGLGSGFVIGLITCKVPQELILQRLGMGLVLLLGLALLLWIATAVLDRALKVFKMYRLFLKFMWDRWSKENDDAG